MEAGRRRITTAVIQARLHQAASFGVSTCRSRSISDSLASVASVAPSDGPCWCANAGQGPPKTPSGQRVTRVDARTFEAIATVQDVQAPAVTIAGGEGLASGRWLRGEQSVRFDASDASGKDVYSDSVSILRQVGLLN